MSRRLRPLPIKRDLTLSQYRLQFGPAIPSHFFEVWPSHLVEPSEEDKEGVCDGCSRCWRTIQEERPVVPIVAQQWDKCCMFYYSVGDILNSLIQEEREKRRKKEQEDCGELVTEYSDPSESNLEFGFEFMNTVQFCAKCVDKKRKIYKDIEVLEKIYKKHNFVLCHG